MSGLVDTRNMRTLGATVAIGLAAIVIWSLVSRRRKPRAAGEGAGRRLPTEPIGTRITPILNFIRDAQDGDEASSSVSALLLRYYAAWYSPAKGVVSAETEAALRAQSSGQVAATLLEGLGMHTSAARTVVTKAGAKTHLPAYSYSNGLALPDDLTEEMLASLPSGPVRTAFTTSDAYYSLCKARKSDATNAVTHSDSVYDALLKRLWDTSFASVGAPSAQPAFSREGDGWGELGFQGKDPITDLRGGGITSLEDYVAFAEECAPLHESMIRFNRAQHAEGGTAWFLEACVSIQLSVQLTTSVYDNAAPSTSGAAPTGGRLLKRRDAPSAPAASPLRFTSAIVAFLYDGPPRDMRRRLQRLHSLYFRAFFELWSRERPFVMEYQSFMDATFYPESALLVEEYLKEAN